MKQFSEQYLERVADNTLEPRYVILIRFTDDFTTFDDIFYITSHADIPIIGVPDEAILKGGLQKISGQTQKIAPEKGQYTIGNVTFNILDVDGRFTRKIAQQLDRGRGISRKRVLLFKGFRGMDFHTDSRPDLARYIYSQQLAYVVDEVVSYKDGMYRMVTSDPNRLVKTPIFTEDTGILFFRLRNAASLENPPIPANDPERRLVYVQPSLSALSPRTGVTDTFRTIYHDSRYSDRPNRDVGYIRIDDEIIAHEGWVRVDSQFRETTSESGTPVLKIFTDSGVPNGRQAFGTESSDSDIDPTDRNEAPVEVVEYFYLEMAAPKLIYALMTGKVFNANPIDNDLTLPDNWHLGIDPSFIEFNDFIQYPELWTRVNTESGSPEYDTGRIVRFFGPEQTNAKSFIENEILSWIGCYMPIDQFGKIRFKKIGNPLPTAAASAGNITVSDITRFGSLNYQQKSLINGISLLWGKNPAIERFLRIDQITDADSINLHGPSPVRRLQLSGVHADRNTTSQLFSYFKRFRDRYNNPPLELKIDVQPKFDYLEVGDIVNVELPQLRDFNSMNAVIDQDGTQSGISRSFEIQSVKNNWINGVISLGLFGSIKESSEINPSESIVMADSWYTNNSLGFRINDTQRTPPGGNSLQTWVTNGRFLFDSGFTSNDNLRSKSSTYYHDGDLTIPPGITVTIFGNVHLKIKGFFTILGTLRVQGMPYSETERPEAFGFSNSGPSAIVSVRVKSNGNASSRDAGLRATSNDNLRDSGNSGIETSYGIQGINHITTPGAEFNRATSIINVPTRLDGKSGSRGRSAFLLTRGSSSSQTEVRGGAGGIGGGGLMITCRGMNLLASGNIDTSGMDGQRGSGIDPAAYRIWGNTGSGGFPGGVLVLIDGNFIKPIFTSRNSTARRGRQDVPPTFTQFDTRDRVNIATDEIQNIQKFTTSYGKDFSNAPEINYFSTLFSVQTILDGLPELQSLPINPPVIDNDPDFREGDILARSFYSSAGTDIADIAISGIDLVSVSEASGVGFISRDHTLQGGNVFGGDNSNTYFYIGDLVIPAGITLTILNNVELRVYGDLTINGNINCISDLSTGMDGIGSTNSGYGAVVEGLHYYWGVGGRNTIESINNEKIGTHPITFSFRPNAVGGTKRVKGNLDSGRPLIDYATLPVKLNGVAGSQGATGTVAGRSGATPEFSRGGTGGLGGGGLIIICRDIVQSSESKISSNGVKHGPASTAGNVASRRQGGDTGNRIYNVLGQLGSSGSSGGVLVVLDSSIAQSSRRLPFSESINPAQDSRNGANGIVSFGVAGATSAIELNISDDFVYYGEPVRSLQSDQSAGRMRIVKLSE